MIPFVLLSLVSAAAAVVPSPAPMIADAPTQLAEVMVRSHVVIRVETTTVTPLPAPGAMFQEKKGPRCLAMPDIAGAAVIARNSVDFALRDGTRMRARFTSSCPGLDYYSGFYIVPPADAKLCAGRDVIRDRAGGECAVDRIRRLKPRK